ncbi:T9SS type A sorting domain-containing protein [Tamlana sp. I1]|uniref:T9SS type A sorting domain-containing protein n=1 Tax=Tamlana sp. I1 TaxID=2762061 RepID=UPI00188FE8A3|nr:T9SS type A sorting domain-containing protein [Tamlana sp. I1]
MKNSLLFIFSLSAYLSFAQCADPVITDFECSGPSHPVTGALITVANPVSGGINTSANVGEYTDDGTAGFDALIIDYGTPIDLSTNGLFKIKFYSSSSVQIMAKLEGGTATPDLYSDFSAVDTWQEIVFDFSAYAADGNTKVVLFFNPTVTTGTPTDIYYIDDLLFDAPPTMCTDPIITDFECDLPSHPITGALVSVANSVSGGINTSANIGEYTDNGTAGFDALTVDYGAAIDLSVNTQLKLKFYSPTSVQILAKLEGGTQQEIYSDFSLVNTWQEFVFDFSASAGNGNTKVVLFFNVAVESGTPTDIYYIDDLRFESATLSTPEVPSNEKLSLYPNPANDVINIASSGKIESYQIFNTLGTEVASNHSNAISKAISINHLNSGIYFIRLHTATSNAVIKFIKQ